MLTRKFSDFRADEEVLALLLLVVVTGTGVVVPLVGAAGPAAVADFFGAIV